MSESFCQDERESERRVEREREWGGIRKGKGVVKENREKEAQERNSKSIFLWLKVTQSHCSEVSLNELRRKYLTRMHKYLRESDLEVQLSLSKDRH